MSPVSRGRKPKKKATKQRSRDGLPPLGTLEACDCPACLGEEPDLAELVDDLLADAEGLDGAEHALAAELLGGSVVAIASIADELAETMVDELITLIEERAGAEAVALLLSVAAVAPGKTGRRAAAAANRLLADGLRRPAWADELAEPVRPGECWRLANPASEQSALAAMFERAGQSHGFLLVVDEAGSGAALDIIPVSAANLPDALDLLEHGIASDDVELARTAIDIAEFRRLAEAALDARAASDQETGFDEAADGLDPDDDSSDQSYPVLAAILRARLAAVTSASRVVP